MHFPNGIPNHYVLLDSDSSVTIFNNAAMLVDIHDVEMPLVLESNGGGHQVTYQMGTIPDFGKVWFNEESIANILSLADVRKARRVTMDSADDNAFHVHKPDGSGYTRFQEHPSGLYLHDSTKPVTPYTQQDGSNVVGYSYLQTVAENKKQFTKRQIESADKSRQLYRMLGRPGPDRYMDIVRNNFIIKCPVTIDDVTRAQRIYGKDVAFLKGKTMASPAKDYVPEQPPIASPKISLTTTAKSRCAATSFLSSGYRSPSPHLGAFTLCLADLSPTAPREPFAPASRPTSKRTKNAVLPLPTSMLMGNTTNSKTFSPTYISPYARPKTMSRKSNAPSVPSRKRSVPPSTECLTTVSREPWLRNSSQWLLG
jgi:hypothetical protein